MAAEDEIIPSPSLAPRHVVVVLGMHRSGTSAVAGCIQRMGVDFGPRLMPATPDNPRGYYEHIDLVNLHDRLLLALGRRWDDTFPFPPAWWLGEAATGRHRAEALQLLRRDFSAATVWGLKDPRLCRLLPWWASLWRETNSAPLFVLVRRPPWEVAASLNKREGFSAAKSSLLWLQHVLEAERNTRGQPRVFVDFKAFVDDWRGALEPVAGLLRQVAPTFGEGGDAEEGGFIDPGLLRSAMPESRPDGLSAWVYEADSAIRLGISGQEREMELLMDHLASELQAAEALFAPGQHESMRDLQHQLEGVRQQAAWYEAEWQKARIRAEVAAEKLAAKRSEVERLKAAFQK